MYGQTGGIKTISIELDEDQVQEILEDYYGLFIEEFDLEVWTKEEIKTAIINR